VTAEGFVEKAERSSQRLREIPPISQGEEGVARKQDHGYSLTRVFVRPRLTVAKEGDRERGLRLLEKAEQSCLVSRSLRSKSFSNLRLWFRDSLQVRRSLATGPEGNHAIHS